MKLHSRTWPFHFHFHFHVSSGESLSLINADHPLRLLFNYPVDPFQFQLQCRRTSTSLLHIHQQQFWGVPAQFSDFYAQRNNAYPLCLAQRILHPSADGSIARSRAPSTMRLPATKRPPSSSHSTHEPTVNESKVLPSPWRFRRRNRHWLCQCLVHLMGSRQRPGDISEPYLTPATD